MQWADDSSFNWVTLRRSSTTVETVDCQCQYRVNFEADSIIMHKY